MNIMYNCEVEIEGVNFKVSFDNGSFSQPKGPVSLHNHGVYEAHVIEDGEFAFRIDGRDVILQKNQCCIISPDAYHSKANPLAPGSCKYCFKFEYSCDGEGSSPICQTLEKIDGVLAYENCPDEIGLMGSLKSEMENHWLGYRDNIRNLCSQLIITMLRNIGGGDFQYKNSQMSHADENRSVVIDSFFATRHMEDVHARDLAGILNLSVRQLGRVLQKQYGLTFSGKLTRIRIQAAKELLENSDMTVAAIAGKVGYNNTRYFNSAFKRITGTTPVKHRNRSSNHI